MVMYRLFYKKFHKTGVTPTINTKYLASNSYLNCDPVGDHVTTSAISKIQSTPPTRFLFRLVKTSLFYLKINKP